MFHYCCCHFCICCSVNHLTYSFSLFSLIDLKIMHWCFYIYTYKIMFMNSLLNSIIAACTTTDNKCCHGRQRIGLLMYICFFSQTLELLMFVGCKIWLESYDSVHCTLIFQSEYTLKVLLNLGETVNHLLLTSSLCTERWRTKCWYQ